MVYPAAALPPPCHAVLCSPRMLMLVVYSEAAPVEVAVGREQQATLQQRKLLLVRRHQATNVKNAHVMSRVGAVLTVLATRAVITVR